MKRGLVITIIVVFTVIIISVVAYLVYKSSKRKSEKELKELQQQLLDLQNQANSSTTTPEQKQNIFTQIASITKILQDSGVVVGGKEEKPPVELPPVVTTPVFQPTGFPLKKGSRGILVENLQKGLNTRCNAKLVTDGAFGPLTENALSSCYNVKEANFELYTSITS